MPELVQDGVTLATAAVLLALACYATLSWVVSRFRTPLPVRERQPALHRASEHFERLATPPQEPHDQIVGLTREIRDVLGRIGALERHNAAFLQHFEASLASLLADLDDLQALVGDIHGHLEGVVVALAAPTANQFLGQSSDIPAWQGLPGVKAVQTGALATAIVGERVASLRVVDGHRTGSPVPLRHDGVEWSADFQSDAAALGQSRIRFAGNYPFGPIDDAQARG